MNVKANVKAFCDEGFHIILLRPYTKQAWQKNWSSVDAIEWSELRDRINRDEDFNFGVRLGANSYGDRVLASIDIDIDVKHDGKQAISLEGAIEEMRDTLGDDVSRVIDEGACVATASGGAHVYFFSDKLFGTRRVRFAWGAVEFRCKGCLNVIPPSIVTGKDGQVRQYKWVGDRRIDFEAGKPLWKWQAIQTVVSTNGGAMADDQGEGGRLPYAFTIGLTRDEVRRLIDHMPDEAADSYESWRNFGFALHHEFQGSEIGFKLFKIFSQKFPEKYDPSSCRRLWKSAYAERKGTNYITMLSYIDAKKYNDEQGYDEQESEDKSDYTVPISKFGGKDTRYRVDRYRSVKRDARYIHILNEADAERLKNGDYDDDEEFIKTIQPVVIDMEWCENSAKSYDRREAEERKAREEQKKKKEKIDENNFANIPSVCAKALEEFRKTEYSDLEEYETAFRRAFCIMEGPSSPLYGFWVKLDSGQYRFNRYNQAGIKESFDRYAFTNEKGQNMATPLQLCRIDKDMKVYRAMTIDPTNTVKNKVNLWNGFATKPYSGDDYLDKCRRIVDHIERVICDNDPVVIEYVINWCANKIQYPTRRNKTVLLIEGGQGSGKDTFGRIMTRVIGPAHAGFDSGERFLDRFNAHEEGRLLMCYEEVNMRRAEQKRAIKAKITAEKMLIERKGVDRVEYENLCDYIMTTNDTGSVMMEENERRFFPIKTNDKNAQNAAYFKALYAEMEGEGIAAFMRYLMEVELDGFVPSNIPMTKFRSSSHLDNGDKVLMFIHERLLTGDILCFDPDQGYLMNDAGMMESRRVWSEGLIRVSKKALQDAIMEYCKEKGWAGVSVREVRKRIQKYMKIIRTTKTSAAGIYQYEFDNLEECQKQFEKEANLPGVFDEEF